MHIQVSQLNIPFLLYEVSFIYIHIIIKFIVLQYVFIFDLKYDMIK